MGKVAIANAKLTYQRYKELFTGPRWAALSSKGAQTQRLLWASTSTKNPSYSDVLYVEELIGPDTVNTIPPATFDAFRDHGKPRASLEEDIDAAQDTMETLETAGISMKKVTDELVDAGRQAVRRAVRQAARRRRREMQARVADRDQPADLQPARRTRRSVEAAIEDWKIGGKVRRLWARDASLWTGTRRRQVARLARDHRGSARAQPAPEGHRRRSQSRRLQARAAARHGRIEPVSGSPQDDFRQDRTASPKCSCSTPPIPAQMKAFENENRPRQHDFHRLQQVRLHARAQIFKQYFFERVKQVVGADRSRKRFIAITDPGSKMRAGRRGRRISATSSTACPASAGATPRSRISAWCRPPSWAWMRRDFSIAPM